MSNISDRMKHNMDIIKANNKIDVFVKEHPTNICDTCKREKETSLFVKTPRSMGYSKRRMVSTCPDCIYYKDLTTNRNYCNLKYLYDCLYNDTRRLSYHCEFIIKYEKENNIKTKQETLNLKELLNTFCEKLKDNKQ